MTRNVKIAAAQYPIEWLPSAASWRDKLERWVGEAAHEGAQLLVFPEYGAMETASLFGEAVAGDLAASLAAVADRSDEADAAYRELAAAHDVWILGASQPVRVADGRIHNRASLFGPAGEQASQDKIVMTRFEREQWGVTGGNALTVFETPLGSVGVTICYDCEFPVLARRLVEAGAEIVLVPSCTDTARGYHRVRTGAQARALESQIAVVHSPTVGDAPWSPAVDTNRGAAAIYVPPDLDFPDDGVLAIGPRDEAAWVYATVDLDRLARCRKEGDVLNDRDWPEQHGVGAVLRRRLG